MPNKKKLYQALKSEGYDNFADESAFNAYVDNADNRKKLFSALKAEGYDNFADEKSFDEYLGYSINQPEDDTVFEANAERFRNGQPTEKVTTQSMIDAHPELGLGEQPYQYKPEVQQRILQNKPDMFKPKHSLIDAPLGVNAPEGSDEKFQARINVVQKNLQDPEYQKSKVKSEFRVLSDSVDADLEKIEDAITSRQKAVRNIDWKPGMPSSRDDAKLSELRGQRTYLEGAKELIEDSQNILNAVEAEKDGSFFGGLGRGIRDKAFDIDTWTMGLSDLVGGLRLKSVLEKAEKGETLTPAEQKLLDASVNNMAVNFYYRNDLGLGYQAGEITGQSIPFMLEFLVNPVSASGNAMAKRLLTYGLKRFGSAVNSKAIKAGTRLATDALAAGGVTATTGMGHVLSGGIERLNKNYEYGLDEEGNLNVVNTHNMGVGEAFAKSATSAFLERQSEMIFNAFRGAPFLFKGIETSLPGGVNTFMNYVRNSRLGELWRGIKNNATMKELAKRTQFHGLGEEYLEEVYNNFANIPLGEMTFEEATDLENNIVTFLGLAPTQVMFSAIGGIGYGVERYKAKRDLERTFGKMNEEQKRKLMELQEMGKLSTNKDIAFFLAETIKDESLTPEQKRAEIEYAYNLAKQNAIDEVSNTDVEDTIESENVAIDAVTNLATGEYIEVDRWVVDGETGVRVPQPGYIVGWIGEAPVLVPEGMENTEENRIVLKPNEWNPETVQRMPAEEVKALNEEMIREEAAIQAEREAKYAPEVLSQEMQQGIPFETEDAIYVPISPMLEGNGWVVEVQPKGVDNKTAARPFTEELTNDQFHDMLQAQLDAQESAQAEAAKVEESNQSIVEGLESKPMEDGTGRVMQPKGVQGNEVVYDITDGNGTVLEEGSMDAAEYNGVSEESKVSGQVSDNIGQGADNIGQTSDSVGQERTETPVIPTKEDGSIDFVSYGKEGTFKALGEKYGEKMPNKVAVTAKALADDLAKAQKKLDKAIEDYDNAPIGREDKAEKARDKAQQELDAIKREADFWAEMDTEIKDAQFRRASMLNPQAETETSSEPMNADEFVAQQLSAGNIVLNTEDYKRETGYGDAEANAMNGGAAKIFGENGMTIQEAGERLMEMDRENGTNFFDQSDSNAGRDALISLLGNVKSRKELNQYIANNRAEQAKKESEGLRNELERSVMDANYASLEDYVLQMEADEMENPFSDVNADEILAIFAEAVEEYNNYLNPQENGQGTTEESIEGNGELLSEEQSSDTGGTEVRQESARNGEGAAEESETADAATEVELKQEEGETTLQFAERAAEENRRRPLRKRAEEWSNTLGVKVTYLESIDDVDAKTRSQIEAAHAKGSSVPGWVDKNGEVFFFMPDLSDLKDVDDTYIHEVVAHVGLPQLLGKERFGELCDKVWEMMPQSAKDYYYNYPGVNSTDDSTKEGKIERQRRAADEYIAHLAEQQNLTPAEKTIWDNIVKMFREMLDKALNGIISKYKLTDEDISNLIKASYANLKRGIQISDFGDKVEVEGVRFNIKTNKEVVENREKQLKRSVRNGILSKKEADEIREASEAMLEIAEVIAQAEKEDGTAMFPSFSQWNGMEVRLNANGMPAVSVLKSNGDYAMNIDFAKDCIKRDATNRVLNRLAQVAPEVLTSMSAEQLTEINNIIKRHGLSVPCVGCFVEARRYRSADFARSVVNVWNAFVDAVGKGGKAIDAAKKEFGNKVSVDNIITHLQDNPSDMVLLSESDIVSPDKYAALMIEHPQVPQLLQGTQGQNNPHLVVPEAIYYGDVLKLEGEKAWDVDAAYAVGGVRIQSFSDFKAKLFFDYCQVLADLASKKLPAHSYTKVPSFAELFGLAGVKINLSLYFEGTGLGSNGEYQYSSESISPEFAYEIQTRDGYTENVGTMAIGVSDAHIWKMMKDPNIRSISPYHKSGINAAVAKKIDASRFVDYSNEQNAVIAKAEKMENETFAEYYARIAERKDGTVPKYGLKTVPKFNLYDDLLNTEDPVQTAMNYVEHCQQNGIVPKFPSFAYNQDGSFNNEYYKLIYDFAVTDKDGIYAPQGAVKWNEDAMPANTAEILTSALEVEEATIARNEEEVDSVVSDILNEVVGEGTRFRVKFTEEEQSIIDKAKEDGTYMKAPNGESTNLTEKRWAQVRTKAFKTWFGDWENDVQNSSKIVDENGEPLVVYHGSEEDFNEFDKTRGRANMDIQGMFFSPWDDDARGYGSNVRAFYLNIRKPANESTGYKALKKFQGQNGAGIKAREYLASAGYDGVNNEDQEFIAFEANQIKSATDNVGTFDEGNNDIRFRFIGERGARNLDKAEEATTRLDNLAVAKEMEAAEKDAKTIKMATGWERGADGLWRYEVDDNIDFELRRPKRAELKKAYEEANEKYYKLEMRVPSRTPKNATEEEKQRIKELRKELAKLRKGMNKAFDAYYDYSAESATLGEFLGKDNQLFKEYPELADYDVSFLRDSKKLAEGLKGSFTPEYKVIWVDDARPKGDIKSTLVHEIQHAIQGIEGFAQGGTPSAFASAKYQAEEWKTNFNEFINRYGFEDWLKNLPIEDWMKYGKEYKGQFGGLHRAFIDNAVEDEDVKKTLTKELGYVKAAYDKFYQIAGGMDPAYKFKDANEWYRSLSGEVESRNVQQRMGMTDEQRRNTLAESTEDVAREDQVFLKDGVESGDTRFRSVNEPAVDYVSQANNVVEVPRDEVMYTMNNIANQLYKTSGRFMRQLYKYGTLGRVLKGEYAEIDQIKAKNEYDHAKPILEEYLNELVWMKYQATEAAQEVINDVILDVEYAMQYYKDLSLGKDVWRTQSSPRFRISEKGKQIQAEVDKFTSKYNSKPVVLVDSEMTDEELEEAVPESSANRTREEISSGYPGGYSRDTDKIYIFVDNQELGDLGTTMFHENLHPMYNGSSMVEELYNNAKEDKKALIEALSEAYEESEIPNEMFAHMIAKDMFRGDFKFAEKYLSEESRNELFNTLKEFGYDRVEEESIRRRQGNLRSDITLDKEPQTSEQVDGGLQEGKAVSPRERKERLGKLFDQVADMGLEGVLENKAYTSMMVDIYKVLPEAVRTEIADDAIRLYGGSVAPAVSDYIGVKSKESIIDKIVTIVREALRKVGFDLDLNANEVRYMAWRSKKPLDRNNLLEVAEDIDMKNRLKVGEYDGTTPDGGGTRFRAKKADPIDVSDERPQIIKDYDNELQTKSFNFQEAFQDRMLSVKVLMDKIVEATGKKVRSFEDVYKAENELGSTNRPAQLKYIEEFFNPLVKKVQELSDEYGHEAVRRYIYCKSGLERNEVLRQRDADEAYNEAKEELDGKLASGSITQRQYNALLKLADKQRKDTLSKDIDYSGIRGLLFNSRVAEVEKDYQDGKIDKQTRDVRINGLKSSKGQIMSGWKKFAEDQVFYLEQKAGQKKLDELWDKINAATNETLRIDFESGMIDRDTYNAEKNMMKYYVPLRNWKDTVAEDMYEYRHDMTPAVSSNQKRAEGRKSEADNPIATIGLMAQNAIVRGNRNKMKMKLYAFVSNRDTPLASIRNVWYEKDATGTWIPKYADTSKAKSEAEMKQILDQFEQNMEALAEQGKAFKGKAKFGMGFRANRSQKDEHVVTVMINGKEYGIYINGNPRAAQAVNGMTNAEGIDDGYAWVDKLKRLYGGGLTSWNPDFIIPNLVRDTIHASTMTFLDRGVLGSLQYMANIPKIFAQVSAEVSGLSTGNPKLHQYFEEFVANGGETGYTEIHTLEDYKKEYKKLINEAKGLKPSLKNGFEKIAKILEAANRIAEDVNRFNAYVTSREAGENIVNSVDAAKNITVNFNRKGALHANSSVFGKVASFMSRWILFFNPSVQGIHQIVTKSKLNPKRATALGATIIASGFLMPMLNEMLVAAFGDGDDDDYWNQSDYKRRNNWMLFTGDGYVSIPLPPVLREIYGMGDIIYGVMTGHIPPQRAIYDVLNQVQSAIGFVTLLPEVSQEPDVKTWLKGFAPDLASPFLDVMSNTNFMGRPIAKWTDYNETDPEYERVYKGVGKQWVEVSKFLNEVRGNETRRSDWWGNMINPAMMEHLVTSYTGGIGKTINNFIGMTIDAVEGDKENMDVFRKAPIVPRFYTPNDEKTVYPGINRKFYEFEYQYNNAKKSLKKANEVVASGEHPEWQKYIDEMEKNGEKKFIEYFKAQQKKLKKLQDKLKEDPNNNELEKQVYDKKAEIATESFKILSGQK